MCEYDICVSQVFLFPKVHTHIACVTIFVTKFINCYTKSVFFNVLPKDNFPFEFYDYFIHYHMVCWVMQF
jgi:hypothetical protein